MLMRLTIVKPYKGNTWQLELDDSGELYFVNVEIVQRFQLQTDMELSEEDWEAVQMAELARKAYSRACYLLDYRAYSYQEMFRKLEPNYPEEVCFETVDRLAANGLINDRAYAEQAAHHYVEVKHFGFRRARQEMRRRGLLDAQIDAALEPYADLTEEFLMELIQGKYQRYFTDPEDRKMVEKGKAALVRQGYSFSEINGAVAEYFEDFDESDEFGE